MKKYIPQFFSLLAACLGMAALTGGGICLSIQPAFAANAPAACDGTANDPVTCTGRTTGNGNVCMGDLSGFGTGINCTANDVSIGFADNITDVNGTPITSCIQNSTLNASGDFHVSTSGGVTRYDIGLYFAVDGDPNNDGAKSGVCSVSKISGPDPSNNVSHNFLQLDAAPDTCGDINNANKPQVVRVAFSTPCLPGPLFFNATTGKCQATDPGSHQHCVILPNGVSWRQTGANDVCDSPLDAFPGTTAKCNVNPTFGIPVIVEQANVGVQKTANPTSVQEPGGTVTYTVTVTNNASFSNLTISSVVDNIYGNLGTNTPAQTNNTCPSLIGTVLNPGGSTSCHFDAPVSGNAGGSVTDIVEVCGDSSGDGNGCGHDDATVTITDVATPPSLSKDVTSYVADITYTVTVTNNSAVDPLTVNSLSDTKFGDITTVHAVGGGFEQVVSTDCNNVLGIIGVSSNKSCTFVGRITNTSANPHVNTVTAATVDDDGVSFSPADNATVTISTP